MKRRLWNVPATFNVDYPDSKEGALCSEAPDKDALIFRECVLLSDNKGIISACRAKYSLEYELGCCDTPHVPEHPSKQNWPQRR